MRIRQYLQLQEQSKSKSSATPKSNLLLPRPFAPQPEAIAPPTETPEERDFRLDRLQRFGHSISKMSIDPGKIYPEPPAIRKLEIGAPADKSVYDRGHSQEPLAEKRPNQIGLPDRLKTGIENLSGYSMDDVRVHYNSDKPAQLQAHAYAQGTDIHVASGQERHLPHEAWHVVQQKQGRVKPTSPKSAIFSVNDDSSLESEADVMGRKALNVRADYLSSSVVNKQAVGAGVVQLNGNGDEQQESWGEWLWRHKWKFALAGITIAAAYLLYKSSGGGEPNIADISLPGSSGGGVQPDVPVPDVSVPDVSVPETSGGGDQEGILMKSLRQAISGPAPGDEAPPCPLDPATGGPNLDAYGDLIEMAVKPMIDKGVELVKGGK